MLGNCSKPFGLTFFTLGEARGKFCKEAELGRLVLVHEGEGNQEHPENHDCKRYGIEGKRKHPRQYEACRHRDGEQRPPAKTEDRIGGSVAALRDV